MDVRQLRYFVQIVESGSLSKAARQLFIVQPALSQQMARLEDEVGKPLLVRSVRGVVPTENGAALYRHAKFVLRQLDEAVVIARKDFSHIEGRVVLGLAPSTSCVLGLPLLRHLREKYPGIVLNVVVALPMYLDERTRQGGMDLAILFSKTAARDLQSELLLNEEIAVIVPAGSQLVPPDKASLSLSDVSRLPLVLSSPNHNLRKRIIVEFDCAGLEPNVVAEIDSLELVMRYVSEGGGATIQPMAASAIPARVPWRCVPIADAAIHRPAHLYALPAHQLTEAATIVRTELKQVVHRLVQEGAWRGVQLAEHEAPRPLNT